MLLEITRLAVPPEQVEAFEAAFHTAQLGLARSPGYLSHELQRHVVEPGHYALLVEWQRPPAVQATHDWQAALRPFCVEALDTHHYHLIAGRGIPAPLPRLRYPD